LVGVGDILAALLLPAVLLTFSKRAVSVSPKLAFKSSDQATMECSTDRLCCCCERSGKIVRMPLFVARCVFIDDSIIMGLVAVEEHASCGAQDSSSETIVNDWTVSTSADADST
jgi:hypothetical protein